MMRWKWMLVLTTAAFAAPAAAGPPRNFYEEAAVQAVQAHIDMYRAWDLDAFVSTFTEDAIVMVDGKAVEGKSDIRAYYASAFADDPHKVQVIESGLKRGLVYITMSYTFKDGYERCCTYANYFVKDGKIAFLEVKMSNRSKRVRRADTEAKSESQIEARNESQP
ncbi:MAG: nuclear transport factor 2 family protein [Pseudomonadota bacterium]